MTLCDTCRAPGSCCKRISLTVMSSGEEIRIWLDDRMEEQVAERMGGFNGFEIESIKEAWTCQTTGRPYGTVFLNCGNLGSDGRCSIYDDRPELCRAYEPGSDRLCVHYGDAR